MSIATTNEEKILNPETQKARIRKAFMQGRILTSYEANRVGRTVDSRKCISDLRKDGVKIEDEWRTGDDGRRFKVYFVKPENRTEDVKQLSLFGRILKRS